METMQSLQGREFGTCATCGNQLTWNTFHGTDSIAPWILGKIYQDTLKELLLIDVKGYPLYAQKAFGMPTLPRSCLNDV